MSNYQDRLDALYQLEFFGMKLGLENIRALLKTLRHPERKFDSIHIAGTNGKGSVAAMLAAVHQMGGKRTGLYTSPHLIDFRERIRVNGEMISQREVARFLEKIWPSVEKLKATFFEVTTAMAFDHFARHKVEIAIVETGLGGRLDATNVLERPLATVITSIGHDHHAQLGPTLKDIAREKAGIIKLRVPVIVNCSANLERIFIQRARALKAPIIIVNRFRPELRGDRFWNSPFPGEHQKENLFTVRLTLDALPYRIPVGIARQGVREAIQLTGLRGRLEEIAMPDLQKRGLRLFLDVGHNPEALMAIRQFFKREKIRPLVIFGIMSDKEIDKVLQIMKSFACGFIAVAADTPRALASAELTARAKSIGLKSKDAGSVSGGIQMAMEQASEGSVLLLAGSHYVIGEFLRELSGGGSRFTLPKSKKDKL